jgi:hypothetical protein
MDRRKVYSLLKANGIPVAEHLLMSREPGSTDVLVEDEDWIEVNGKRCTVVAYCVHREMFVVLQAAGRRPHHVRAHSQA